MREIMPDYKREEWQRYFREFLGTCNVLNEYCMACAEQGRRMFNVTWTYTPGDWLAMSFNFHQTREGHEFWNRIDDDWLEFVKAIKTEEERG